MRQEDTLKIAKLWCLTCLWLHHKIIGTTFDFRGLENIPKGPLIVASKHQSVWETLAIIVFLDDPVYILKHELTLIPIFGWYLKKAQMLSIKRNKKNTAMVLIKKNGKVAMERKKQIIIFPEGTRTKPNSDPKYKIGVSYLYNYLNCSVVPVALNSGLFWPSRSFVHYPGTIVLEFLPAIVPGLTIQEFSRKLQEKVETASERLTANA